ncbi:MAG TPA: class F sortase, partial [Candidatus Saccharimonadales bacterium]|nr:class F sortase [Candidatus Saccharimonadales bacterium]
LAAIICLGMVWWPDPKQLPIKQKESPVPSKFTTQPSKPLPVIMAKPRTMRIPSLKIEAPIQEVGLTKGGDMAAPTDGKSVGWYRFGPVPGAVGNAVLAGHLDIKGAPAIFWNLQNLKLGDVIEIKDEQAQTAKFKVVDTLAFKVDDAPLERIFGTTDQTNLNLITCSGVWHKDKRDYSERLVVFTQLLKQ